MKVNWIPALELEQKVAGIIQRQEDAGFQFDKEGSLGRNLGTGTTLSSLGIQMTFLTLEAHSLGLIGKNPH